ncbi:hypothetical protein Purlil1_13693 [Purpureocillium lilacinum]|uniref:Uncharacterized protein n=1 Tax=Purpureocillium lilacinum TaxID=33203 RepID=A0ABR0BDC6_PURLI|nr:hypothetical protein Purlil1_13693 [Purpureocillium lilacinum]
MSRLERATVKSLLINVILVHCQTSNCATKAGIDRVSLLDFFIDYKSRGYATAVKIPKSLKCSLAALTPKRPQSRCVPTARLDYPQISNHPHHESHLSFICLSRRRGPVLIRRAATKLRLTRDAAGHLPVEAYDD